MQGRNVLRSAPRWFQLAAVAVAVVSWAGCGGSTQRTGSRGPILQVLTAAYPLAQAVDMIGSGKARATDLVPPGSDPFTYQPTPNQISEIQQGGLLVLAGQRAQPAVYEAGANAKQKVDASMAASEQDYWLDPAAMRQAVPSIEGAMERADPANAPAFRDGARALDVELDSTSIDYQSTLSACPRRTVFAADNAFAGVARRYFLDYTPLGTALVPDPATVKSESDSVKSAGATSLFAETWEPASTVDAVAAQTGVKVRTLDTLLGPPPGGWPRQANYINLLESNLGHLSDALGCASSGS